MSDKMCIVLKCGNTSEKNPEKLFIPVPIPIRKRTKWLLLARIDPKSIENNSNVFMCEDHFNIPKDIPNYMKYKMGFTQKIFLVDGVLPSKFDCFEDNKKTSRPSTSHTVSSKKQRLDLDKKHEDEKNNQIPDRKSYRWCAVPRCGNTSVSAPNKMFICVPHKTEMRRKWFQMAGRNTEDICDNSTMFFCEDHFDLPNDMDNYIRYRIMGSVKKIIMKPGCLPSKFDCHSKINESPSNSRSYSHAKNKKRIATIQGSLEDNGGLDNENAETNKFMIPNAGMRCPMIQIPLSTNQFAPPVDSDTDSDAEYGVEIFSQESVVPSELLLNEIPVDMDDTTTEVADDVPENMSMYCDEEDAPSHKEDPQPKGEVTLFGGFRCSVCDVTITGFRYTCVQCHDFDLCGACESNREHQQHYMLRIPTINSYPDVQSVLDTIRRHLMKDLDPISELELEPDPGERVKSEIKSEDEDDTEITVENDGFDNIETSGLFKYEQQETNIPSVRPVAVIRVNEEQNSSLPGASESSCESTGKPHVKRKFHITMSELPDITQGKTRRVLLASNNYNGGNASGVKLQSANRIDICIPPQPATIIPGQGSDTESEYESGAPGQSTKKKLRTEIAHKMCVTTYSRQDFKPSETQSTDYELRRLNEAPKTSAERGREFRAREALLKQQSKQQHEPDVIVEIATEDIRSAGPSEDKQVPGPSGIRIIEKRAKSAEATRRWREKKKGVSESSKKQAKTAAQRMREYRKRKKMLNEAPNTSAERGREFRAREALLKQSKQQHEPDAIVEIDTKDIRSDGPSEDNRVPGPSEISTIEKRAKSANATRRSRERKNDISESSKKQAKTAAQRMREYRKRKKNCQIRRSLRVTTEHPAMLKTRDEFLQY